MVVIDGCEGQVHKSNEVHVVLFCFFIHFPFLILVSGEANFSMDRTGLTVGGFVQPGVAKGLIESAPNIEKGLCQRFLWIVPKPNPTNFEELGSIDEDFTKNIGKHYNIF